ncbi:MAG: ferredoxin-thioredoxin reductase catalytic domain-containing protein [Candidatus Aminicenantales bacterium]
MLKKRFWRCYVCDDLHWGVKPPEECPTCRVKNAYVEISPEEARVILERLPGPPGAAFAPEEFRRAITDFAAGNEFKVNPDKEKVSLLLAGITENEKNHGLKFCPCRLISKDPIEDLQLVCPCNFPSHETYRDKAKGECWCGLFIRR